MLQFYNTDLHTLCENHLKKSTTAVAILLSKEESVVVEESSTETVVFSGQKRVTQEPQRSLIAQPSLHANYLCYLAF